MSDLKELLMDSQEGDQRLRDILIDHEHGMEIDNPGFSRERPNTVSVNSLGGEEFQISWIEKFDAQYSQESVIFAQAWDGNGEEILLVWNEAAHGWKRVNTNPFLTIPIDGESSRNGRDRT